MGLFNWLRTVLFGAPPQPTGDFTPDQPPPAGRDVHPVTGERVSHSRARLDRLEYRSSLIRTPSRRESAGSDPPYQFAHRNPRTGRWLDLTTDADPRWLDYYGLPHLKTPADLADWLEMPIGRLGWLTHRFCDDRRPPSAQTAHYHFQWLNKKTGGHRLIESPKTSLKGAQRKILSGIIERIPPHRNAHGFVAGRSILSNARPHVGAYAVLKLDLENFYPSVRYSRVVAIFRSVGFSRDVAIWLARLTTSAVPHDIPRPAGGHAAVWPYFSRHLPQGAPTSPALANLSAYSLDVRLTGMARAYDVTYTRYADDLTFSGSYRFAAAIRDFAPLVTRIVRDERFKANRSKQRIIRRNKRQTVTGVVVNEKPNISRDAYDTLKAILTNCAKRGPSTQNRGAHENFAAHLRGRIAHVAHLNPRRGAKLLQLYATIDWSR
ncbi:MAG: RNA-directed DNA polymerase [Planctomycetota bacterium]|nr:MAG: RNA-directed DNA polymerase [Planctomycetota bacterium]REK21457.1 MAG: RNA-directed DNA polymerase [Planctomycetota bacterium]REK40031.1 MAG: RNA-directed DNA polymerase [Planctomycetota bacterium]